MWVTVLWKTVTVLGLLSVLSCDDSELWQPPDDSEACLGFISDSRRLGSDTTVLKLGTTAP